jgi:hypothetical protein
MELTEALALTQQLIDTGTTHQDYKRVNELADKYRIYITGIGIEKELIQIVRREDREMFDQRKKITKSITPAVASSVRSPFNKVARNDRVKKAYGTEDKTKLETIELMAKSFFGSPRKKNKGLEYWMKTRFVDLQFIDPNTWVVVEWDAVDATEIIKPRPFEVSSKMAKHFSVINDEVKWLFIEENIKFKGNLPGAGAAPANPNNAPGVIAPAGGQKVDGCRYTLYDEDFTIVFEQIDPEVYELQEKEVTQEVKGKIYVVRSFEPKLGYPPAFRIGYKRDDSTDARTFVNPWHDALCYFDKSLKTVSELDLTMTLHAFPQKIQYVQQCVGVGKKKCTKGSFMDGTQCTACHGTGYRIHTTAQDAILLPMPDDKSEQLNLDNILIYKSPPIDIIKFQNDYTQQLERQAHQAVYNSQVFVKAQTGTQGSNKSSAPVQTATEADFNMQSVYDALEPFTEKFSEVWKDIVTTFGLLAALPIDKIEVVHEFPADYKLKTDQILLAERQVATTSGAAQFIIETIDDDLAGIIYAGDMLAMIKYRVRRRFFPFNGNTPEEIAMLVASQWVPDETKILYCNFDMIFKDLQKENVNFYTAKNAVQDDLVAKKVAQFQEKIKSQQPTITIDSFRNAAPGNNGGANPGQNNGNNGNAGNNNPGN